MEYLNSEFFEKNIGIWYYRRPFINCTPNEEWQMELFYMKYLIKDRSIEPSWCLCEVSEGSSIAQAFSGLELLSTQKHFACSFESGITIQLLENV